MDRVKLLESTSATVFHQGHRRGLTHLKGLTQLGDLRLHFTKITDVGLMHLKGLKNLEKLVLTETNVTDAEVEKLQQALPKCQVYH